VTELAVLVRGMAAGACLVMAGAIGGSTLNRDQKIAGVLANISLSAWVIAESRTTWPTSTGGALAFYPLFIVATSVGGTFWLYLMTVFEDWPVTFVTLTPAIVFTLTGVIGPFLASPRLQFVNGLVRNIPVLILMLHAFVVVARGWRGDLLEARRNARVVILGGAAAYGAFELTLSFVNLMHPLGSIILLTENGPYGGMIIAAFVLTSATLLLQPRFAVFETPRNERVDVRAEMADQAELMKLTAAMTSDIWRREGLTIGQLAREVGMTEHRLRHLINVRLGHRNFAQFLNAHRIEVAKQRLADPANATKTVAEIAFDLGFGSLGPFNRAFREMTGATPTVFRRQALESARSAA